MNEGDACHLERVMTLAIKTMLPLATSGNEIIAVGEFIEAIELWLEEERQYVEINVELGINFTARDSSGFEETQHADVRVNEDSVEFSLLNRTYSPEIGSDHHSEILCYLTDDTSIDPSGFDSWIKVFSAIEVSGKCRLSVSRDHI